MFTLREITTTATFFQQYPGAIRVFLPEILVRMDPEFLAETLELAHFTKVVADRAADIAQEAGELQEELDGTRPRSIDPKTGRARTDAQIRRRIADLLRELWEIIRGTPKEE